MCALAFLENGHESIVAVHGTVHMQGFFYNCSFGRFREFPHLVQNIREGRYSFPT